MDGPRQPGLGRLAIRNPLDFFGGIALIAIALIALWASQDLAGSRGISFGTGTAPRLFAGLLAAAGMAVVVLGLIGDGNKVGRYPIRGPILITSAILAFAGTVNTLGLAPSTFISILVAAAASPETRWRELIAFAVVLTVFCTLLFHYLVGMTTPIWPWS
jgi:putative tricarboxylic transport membrane protein